MEGMNVKIGVDISDLLAGMQKAGKSLSDFQNDAANFKKALASATDPDKILSLNKAIDETEKKIKAISTAGLNANLEKTSQTSQGARQAMQNLGDTIRDVPFGINSPSILTARLDHLVESFKSTVEQTGSVKAAISSMGASLSGFGGIALGFVVLSTAFALFHDKILGASEAEKAQAEAAKNAKKETDDFKESLISAEAGARSSGISLRAYVDIARDSAKPLSERNEALKEANKIMGEHGEKLTLVNINTKAVTEEVNKFTEALIQQAIAAKYADRIADLTIKQTQAAKDYNKEVASLNAGFKLNQQIVKEAGGFANVDIFKLADTGAQAGKARIALNAYNAATGELKDVTNDFNGSLGKSVELFGKVGEKAKAAKKELTISDIVKDLNKEIRGLNGELDGNFIDEKTFDKKLVDAYEKAIKGLNEIHAPVNVIAELTTQIQPTQVAILEREVKAFANEAFSKDGLKLDVPVNPQPVLDKSYSGKGDGIERFNDTIRAEMIAALKKAGQNKGKNNIGIKFDVEVLNDSELKSQFDALQKGIEDNLNSVNDAVQSTAKNIGTTIAESLGDALSGKSSDLFGNIFSIIGAGLKQLGEAEVAYATSLIVLKNAISNPFVALAAGIAAIAVGEIMQNSIPKFATGGLVGGTGNTDNVHALLTPGEFVLTKDTVNRIGLGNLEALNSNNLNLPALPTASRNLDFSKINNQAPAVDVSGTFVLKGSDLLHVIDRATKSKKRTT